MIEPLVETVPRSALGRLASTRGIQAALRAAAFALPVVAYAGTSAAAGSAPGLVGTVVVGLAGACALAPDSHLGLLVTVIVGLHWLLAVDDVTTPWSLVVGLALGGLHLAMAAAGVAPPGARWTATMVVRWRRRAAATAAMTMAVWTAVWTIDRLVGDRRLDGRSAVGVAVMVAALGWLTLAIGWVRRATMDSQDL